MTYPPGPPITSSSWPSPQPPPKKSSTGLWITLAVIGLVVLGGLALVVGTVVGRKMITHSVAGQHTTTTTTTASTTTTTTTTTTAPPTPRFAVGDCVQVDTITGAQKADCSNNSGPYRVVEVRTTTSGRCPESQGNWPEDGFTYCLAATFLINYCYTIPTGGTWTQPAECQSSGSIQVLDVVQGVRDKTYCHVSYFNQSYYFDDPTFTICVMQYD